MKSKKGENSEFTQLTQDNSRTRSSSTLIRLLGQQDRVLPVSQRPLRSKSNLRNNPPLLEKNADYVGQLEEIIVQKNDQLEKLQHLNNFLEQAVKKREELARAYFEENTRLKEAMKIKDKQISVLKSKLGIKKKAYVLSSANTSMKGNVGNLETNFLKDSFDPLATKRQTHSSLSRSPHHSRGNSMTLNDHHHNDILGIDKREHSSGSNRRNSRHFLKSSEEAERPGTDRPGTRDKRKAEQRPIYTARAITVTESQGRKDFESLFFGSSGRISILDMNQQDLEKVLKDPKVLELESLVSEVDSFKETVNSLSNQNLGGVLDMIKSMTNDVKNLLNIIISLKKLLKATSSISVSLVLNDVLERIGFEISDILNCDKATVYLVDESSQELWSKAAHRSNVTIRIPLNSGVAGYVATSGKSLRIDEAYLDPRFNKEADNKSSYRTKTILAVPIKDSNQRVIGVCEAVNKNTGVFTPDDEAVFRLLANQAGVMLKNSIQFDQDIVNHHRLIRLLKLGIDMFDATTLGLLIYKAENGLKEIMFADKAVVYVVDQSSNSFYKFNANGEKVSFPLDAGIVGLVAKSGEILDISDPYNHPSFHSLVDIETNIPMLCLPVKDTKGENKILAVMQVLNLKALRRRGKGKKQDLAEGETLHLFQVQVATCIEQFERKRTLKLEKVKNRALLSFYRKSTKHFDDDKQSQVEGGEENAT